MSLYIDINKDLSSFNLEVAMESKGGIIGFLGASGSGKSMTLKCIAGLEKADSGKIIINEKVLFDSENKINIKTKDQDFSMSRKLYLQSSYDPQFNPEKTVKLETHLGYVLAEMKTNLDKTMFQEASATAHDIKQAVTGAKYYLLCDYLDMTPISTTTTDIDEILILRKAKRISSNIRKEFSTKIGREKWRPWYTEYLMNNPYSVDMFKRFINHIFSQMSNEELIEESVLEVGYF